MDTGSKAPKTLKPVAGVRYDGLYKVTGYSVSAEELGSGRWRYRYSLERLTGQLSLDAVLSTPSNALVRQALYDRMERAGSSHGKVSSAASPLKKDSDEYWGISKRVLDLTPKREETIGTYSQLQRNFALAAVERLKREGGT